MRFLRSSLHVITLGLLSACASFAQADCTQATTSQPCVDKVDPPSWWVPLPSPLLLLHGRNLSNAKVSVGGKGVSVERTQSSSNGHYLFVWLGTERAVKQTLSIRLTTPQGSTNVSYTLAKREGDSHAFQGFSSRDVMYLLMPDRFSKAGEVDPSLVEERDVPNAWHGGNLKGIEQHLDYLKQLGITTVWTTPIVLNGSNPVPPAAAVATPTPATAGQAVVRPAAPVPAKPLSPAEWPTAADLRVLEGVPSPAPNRSANAAPAGRPRRPATSYHGYGATDLYTVDPHFGTLEDFQHLAQAVHAHGMKLVLDLVPNHVGGAHPWLQDPPAPDWFHGTFAQHHTFKTEFFPLPDPHASEAERQDVVNGWFGSFGDLNQDNPLVSKYEIQNAIWWIQTAGLDGLRLDTFPYVQRTFWHDYHAALHALYPHLTTVGEVYNSDPTITSYFAGGVTRDGVDTGLDTPFDFPIFFMLRKVLLGNEPMYELENILRQDRLYPHPERLVTFLGNHDTTRFLGEPGATPADLQMAFALLATMRGMPQIYSGDEIAMVGGRDPDNRRDFPGGFAGDKENAFTAAGRHGDAAAMFDYLSGLLNFRAAHTVLQTGQQQDIFRDKTVFGYVRAGNMATGCSKAEGERVLVVANHSHEQRTIELPAVHTVLEHCSDFVPQFGSLNATATDHGTVSVDLAADRTAMYIVR